MEEQTVRPCDGNDTFSSRPEFDGDWLLMLQLTVTCSS